MVHPRAVYLHEGQQYFVQSLDLAYAPPFAPVWDPVLVAANVLAKQV